MRIIAGRWGGRRIDAPTGGKTRPTTDRVREAWMSALQPLIPGARVLDLFAGSGALGLETLSRGAAHVTFVERANAPLRALRGNIEKLGAADGTEIIRGDAMSLVKKLEADAYDLVLADPPYGEGLAAALVNGFAATPYAAWLWVEHRVSDVVPELPGSRSRRYGDTIITSIPAPE
jgi:16S rRNA (guanine966-N2)-methyltransferase